MQQIKLVTPPTIDISISNVISNENLNLTLNEYEYWTLRLEFAQGLRPFDKVKYALDNEEGTILQDGSCTLAYEPFSMSDDLAFEIFILKNKKRIEP